LKAIWYKVISENKYTVSVHRPEAYAALADILFWKSPNLYNTGSPLNYADPEECKN